MTYFIIFTLLFWGAQSAALFFFLQMTKEGQLLDILFGWDKMLNKLYNSEKKWKNLLEKALGGCNICTAFWMSPICFALYCLFAHSLGIWVISGVLPNLIWFWAYWVIGGSVSFHLLKKDDYGL